MSSLPASFPQPIRHDRHPFPVYDLVARPRSIARNGASNLIIAGTDKRQYVIRRAERRVRGCQKPTGLTVILQSARTLKRTAREYRSTENSIFQAKEFFYNLIR